VKRILLPVLALVLSLQGLQAVDPTPLMWRNPTPTSANIRAVTFGNGQYVAVGEDDGRGNVFLTADGVSWTYAKCSGASLGGVTFGAGQFVAVGDSGVIYTSNDGRVWSEQTSGTTQNLAGVAYGNGQFVAVGYSVLLTSPDSVHWTNRGTWALTGVTYGNGTWIAVGYGGVSQATILASTNGFDWTNRTLVTVWPYENLYGITYGPAGFVAVGNGYEDKPPVAFSPDGLNWTQVTVSNSWYLDLKAVCVSDGTYVGVGQGYYGGGYSPMITRSTNATNWTKPTVLTPSGILSGIAASGEGFLTVGSNGRSAISSDGINWTLRGPTNTGPLSGICFANGKFTAVGVADPSGFLLGPGVVASSGDGGQWTFAYVNNASDSSMYDITYANGIYVAVGGRDGPSIETSIDGVSWTSRSPSAGAYQAVTHGAAGFVAVGGNYYGLPAAAASSIDGVSWTNHNDGLASSGISFLHGVAYGAGLYVAVGTSGGIAISDDGAGWFVMDSGTSSTLNDIIFNDGVFVAVGASGTVLTSPNGMDWAPAVTGFTDTLNCVGYGDGTYVAVGTGGAMAISTNAVNWTKVSSGTTANLADVRYGNGTFVVVGAGGTILQSRSFRPRLAGEMTSTAFEVRISEGEFGWVYRLQAASDLIFTNPIDLVVYSNRNSTVTVADKSALTNPQRFYRLVSP
jgi:hypothetical protein